MIIHDGYLLTKVIEFCDEIKKDNEFSRYNKGTDSFLKHPMDQEVKRELEALSKCLKFIDNDYKELSYESCDLLDKLWNDLIEKSVMCLRFFDKREPFKDNGKEPFVYGLDALEKYHKKYIEFEGVLYGSDAYYRDHVFHVIRVWMLGVFLLLSRNRKLTKEGTRLIDSIHFEGENVSNDEPKTAFTDELSEKQKRQLSKGALLYKKEPKYKIINKNGKYELTEINRFSEEINVLEKISMWTIMSLCHDLGYPLEKSKKVLEKTEKMMEFFVAQPSINGNIRFDGTRDSNNKDILLFASKKMKTAEAKDESPQYMASIQEKYKFKYMLSLEAFAHGVISAIIIYKKLIYFKETDNNSDANYVFGEEDARQFYIRRDILRAMASHTCRDIYHIDVAVFPMLLFVCDELQEWGRKSWKDMYKGVANNAVKLSIESYSPTEIAYTETIDMKNAGREQIVDNIVRIVEHQYLLYQTTFRDGQDTARRKFDFKKHIEITISDEFRSIEGIVIDFSINHEKENEFILAITDSGESVTDQKENIDFLVSEIKRALEPYTKDNKYGRVTVNDERKDDEKK